MITLRHQNISEITSSIAMATITTTRRNVPMFDYSHKFLEVKHSHSSFLCTYSDCVLFPALSLGGGPMAPPACRTPSFTASRPTPSFTASRPTPLPGQTGPQHRRRPGNIWKTCKEIQTYQQQLYTHTHKHIRTYTRKRTRTVASVHTHTLTH